MRAVSAYVRRIVRIFLHPRLKKVVIRDLGNSGDLMSYFRKHRIAPKRTVRTV